MPIELQVKLLRVLESGSLVRVGGDEPVPVNVRLIAASNRSAPGRRAATASCARTCYYRINVFPIALPPLRDRDGDVLLLADQFLESLNAAQGTSKRLSAAARERIQAHPWRGNVRELKNELQRAFILSEGVIELCGPEPGGRRPPDAARPSAAARSRSPSASSSSPRSSSAPATRRGRRSCWASASRRSTTGCTSTPGPEARTGGPLEARPVARGPRQLEPAAQRGVDRRLDQGPPCPGHRSQQEPPSSSQRCSPTRSSRRSPRARMPSSDGQRWRRSPAPKAIVTTTRLIWIRSGTGGAPFGGYSDVKRRCPRSRVARHVSHSQQAGH